MIPATTTNTPPATTGAAGTGALPTDAVGTIGANVDANSADYEALFAKSTETTLRLQTMMIVHNLTVAPAMKAKEASDDAKK
jgi:hypothetical protein